MSHAAVSSSENAARRVRVPNPDPFGARMTRQWDDASAVRSVAFDRATHTLRVELGSGDVYDFADVPERLYDELGHAPDRDAFFRQHICDEFSVTRVGDIDLGQLARERREDAILGAPLAEQ